MDIDNKTPPTYNTPAARYREMGDLLPIIEKKKQDVLVLLEWDGEGIAGAYDEDDPFDYPCLRFTVLYIYPEDAQMGYQPVDDGSFCTHLSATIEQHLAEKACQFILDTVYTDVVAERSIDRKCQILSHLCLTWFYYPTWEWLVSRSQRWGQRWRQRWGRR